MALPPTRPPAAPVLSPEEKAAAEKAAVLAAAKVIEGHVDAWLKGHGASIHGQPVEVSIGEHGGIRPEVQAALVDSYRAAGWTKAAIGGEGEGDALDPRGIVLYLTP